VSAVATHHCLLANYVVLFWIEIKDFSVKNLKWWQIATAVTFVVQAVDGYGCYLPKNMCNFVVGKICFRKK